MLMFLGVSFARRMSYVKIAIIRDKNLRLFGLDSIPVVNMTHDVDQIVLDLERLILDKPLIIKMSAEATKFAEEKFSAEIMARQYLDLAR